MDTTPPGPAHTARTRHEERKPNRTEDGRKRKRGEHPGRTAHAAHSPPSPDSSPDPYAAPAGSNRSAT
jgi:hypothetical protein